MWTINEVILSSSNFPQMSFSYGNYSIINSKEEKDHLARGAFTLYIVTQ